MVKHLCGHSRKRILTAFATVPALTLTALTLPLLSATPALATAAYQTGPFWPGNLIDYAGSDGESGTANWISVTDATVTDTTARLYSHTHSVLDTVGTAGASTFKYQEGVTATRIDVTGGDEYRIGAYFRLSSAAAGQTVQYKLGCYDSSNVWIGWSAGTTSSLQGLSTGWQYATETITVPANCDHVVDSPEMLLSGMAAGETVYLDSVTLQPYRAATSIGFYAGATASGWVARNTPATEGPAQSNKEFFPGALPTTFAGTDCAGIEASYTDHTQWPVCIIAYKTVETQTALTTFIQSIPADQAVVLVFHQEPENDAFSGCAGGGTGNGPQFVCYYEDQVNKIRAAGDFPNVLVSDDALGYQYGSPADPWGHNGYGCSFVTPTNYVDVYTIDQYENGQADGKNYETTKRADLWNNWVKCTYTPGQAIPIRPIGLGENGFDMATTITDATSTATLSADNSYLAGFPDTGDVTASVPGTQVAVWNWWNQGNSDLESYADVPPLWQSFETANGGG